MHVDSSKCLQNGLLKRQAPAFQKNGLWTIQWRRMESLWILDFSAHPNIIFCLLSLGTESYIVWLSLSFDAYERAKVQSFLSVVLNLTALILSISSRNTRSSMALSSLFSLSLSLMYQGIFLLPWNVFLLFYNTLFVDQWPFSVALLQFGVYLSLILAIKSFAFETDLKFLSWFISHVTVFAKPSNYEAYGASYKTMI